MIRTLTSFVAELRAVGLPVSMVEVLDAAEALRHTDLDDPESLEAALGAAMVKNGRHYPAFHAAFEIYFGLRAAPAAPSSSDETPGGAAEGGGAAGGGGEADELSEAIVRALASGDTEALRRLVREAVSRLAGMEPGRPVGGRYYYYRVMRRLGAEDLPQRLLDALHAPEEADPLLDRLQREEADRLTDRLRDEVRREILRRLVDDRGADQVARTVRPTLVEDLDLMHATREELDEIERAVAPLARKLATRLSVRRRRSGRGRLDVRRTIRRSLAHGGALVEPQFKAPPRSKPELVILCDVSGSMATFARFTLQLTSAISSELSKVRSFAFIDGLDEVTGFFGPHADFHSAVARMGAEADLVRRDGHSDYGRSLREFTERYADAVTAKTTLVITGDARNNYRDTGVEHLQAVAQRARAVFWLNPEAQRYWDTGDSIMTTYASVVDRVEQVRTLRQLEAFVERVALPSARPPRRVA